MGRYVLVAVLGLPVAWALPFFTLPFWRWLDDATDLKIVGHSSFAEWVHWSVFVVYLASLIGAYVWRLPRQRDGSGK